VPWWKTGWVALPILGVAGVLGAAIAALREPPPPSPPLCPGIDSHGGALEGIDYVERRSGKAGAELTLPMLIVLHGGGHNPKAMADRAAEGIPVKARVIAPTGFYIKADEAGEGHPHWRDPSGQIPLREDAAQITSFLEQIRRCRPTLGKPVIAGYDEGADLAYLLAVQQPDLVSTVIMAGGMPDLRAGLPTAPVLGLHGVKDTVAPYDTARNAYHGLIASGAPVRFLRMFGVTHSFAGALQIKLWHEAARALAAIHSAGG
jgi:predicted esterase